MSSYVVLPRRALACALLLGAVACSDDTAQEPPTTPITRPGSADDFYLQLAGLLRRDVCRQLFDCATASNPELVVLYGRHADEAACRKSDLMRQLLIDDGRRGEAEGLAAGRLVYDADKALECLKAVDATLAGAAACEVTDVFKQSEAPAACDQVIVGAVPVDGDCALDRECATPGATCQGSELCEGKCAAPAASTCGDGPECGDDAYCRYGDSGATCVPKVALGQPCDDYEACVDGATCDSGGASDDLTGATCKALYAAPAGAGCDSSQVCAFGLSCGDDGKCGAITLVAVGAPCGLMEGQPLCAPGLVCELKPSMLDGVCVPLKGAGEACGSAFECELSLYCDGDTLKCAQRLASGASCNESADCSTFYCDDSSRCATRPQEMLCAQ